MCLAIILGIVWVKNLACLACQEELAASKSSKKQKPVTTTSSKDSWSGMAWGSYNDKTGKCFKIWLFHDFLVSKCFGSPSGPLKMGLLPPPCLALVDRISSQSPRSVWLRSKLWMLWSMRLMRLMWTVWSPSQQRRWPGMAFTHGHITSGRKWGKGWALRVKLSKGSAGPKPKGSLPFTLLSDSESHPKSHNNNNKNRLRRLRIPATTSQLLQDGSTGSKAKRVLALYIVEWFWVSTKISQQQQKQVEET